MKKIIILFICTLLITNLAVSQKQSIKDYLDSYIGENAKPYLQPLADLFSSNVNTNVWDWSNFDSKFYFRFKVQAMVSIPTDAMRTFQGKTSGNFHPQQTVTAPTIIGDRNSIILQGEDTTFYLFPGGYNLKRLTLGTPQFTIGGFLNTEISGRFLSFPLGQDLGSVRFIGIGGRHSLSAYFKNPPFDLSIGYFYHHIDAGSYLNSDQHLFTAHLGKSGKFFSGQLMLGYQTSNSRIHYIYQDDDTMYNVNLSLNNHNPWIMEVSSGLRLGPLFATGSISYAQHLTFALGAGLFL